MKKQVAIVAALFAIVLCLLHLYASREGWYESRLFFDKYMHFLGGIFVFFALTMRFLRRTELPYNSKQLVALIIFVFIVGFAWEVFEYIVQHFTGVLLATIPDSVGDIVFDVFGGTVAAFMLFLVQYG